MRHEIGSEERPMQSQPYSHPRLEMCGHQFTFAMPESGPAGVNELTNGAVLLGKGDLTRGVIDRLHDASHGSALGASRIGGARRAKENCQEEKRCKVAEFHDLKICAWPEQEDLAFVSGFHQGGVFAGIGH